mmetsp:Transcript_58464/g.125622  ORF Transcript_58464/g.125622 Transcript_58464/m.125622 type:complete len:248 (-) Transcript_58464:927-1670(-)
MPSMASMPAVRSFRRSTSFWSCSRPTEAMGGTTTLPFSPAVEVEPSLSHSEKSFAFSLLKASDLIFFLRLKSGPKRSDSRSVNFSEMKLRNSTMSLKAEGFESLSSKIFPMKSSKDFLHSSPSSASPSKMKLAKSMMPSGLTSTSTRAKQASLCSKMLMNSTLEILKSQSLSMSCMICINRELTKVTFISSFSVAATAKTPSHRTPISMFMTVSAERSMKTMNTNRQRGLSSLISEQIPARSSSRVP